MFPKQEVVNDGSPKADIGGRLWPSASFEGPACDEHMQTDMTSDESAGFNIARALVSAAACTPVEEVYAC